MRNHGLFQAICRVKGGSTFPDDLNVNRFDQAWRGNAALVALVRAGAIFVKGKLVERPANGKVA